MRRLVALIAVPLVLWAAPAALAIPANVVIAPTGFNPQNVTIEAGETVTWRNTDAQAHRVVVQGTSCNLSLQPAQSSSCEFNTAGRFNYSDPGETGSGFRGTIEVEAAPTRGVTLQANRNIVIFGGSITLSGAV